MLELDDIQHILLTRTPAMTGRYEFLSFDNPAAGRAWLSELVDVVESAASVRDTMDDAKRWVTLGFTWNGLRALGVSRLSQLFPRSSGRAWPPGRTFSATPVETTPTTGSGG
jgi:hypothetical protein